jgi:hypothetical protein
MGVAEEFSGETLGPQLAQGGLGQILRPKNFAEADSKGG